MATIEILTGANLGETHELTGRETLLGRHPECQVVFRDSTVSRRHARITRDGDDFYVDDMGSQHGTRVNGEQIRFPRRLVHGDEIQLSQITLVFSSEDGSVLEGAKDRPSTIVTSLDVLGDAGLRDEAHAAPKCRALLEITRSLGVSLNLKEILPKVLENIFRILPQASRGCILLADPSTRELKPFAVKPAAGKSGGPPAVSRTISQTVMSEAKALLSTDAGEDERFQASESVLDLNMRSLLCAPLIGAANQPFGMIHLDAQDPGAQFSPDDLDVLVNIANLVGQAVDHAHLHETQLAFDRRERDMETARQVQQHFLPRDRPDIEGYSLYDYYQPTDAVGGDYFGYTFLPDGSLAIAVGDVAGHGVPAALLMARLCSEARYCLVTDIIPCDAVDALNRELCKQSYSYFITFALCVLDHRQHELTVVNAGHMPPLCRRAKTGQVESLCVEASSPPLGIESGLSYQQAKVRLEPGDVVVMYTDGVSEAINADGARYGIDRVESIVAAGSDARSVVDMLIEDVQRFSGKKEQEDDVCIVAFARNAK